MRIAALVFEEAVTRHHGMLHRTAVRLTKKTQDAEDLVQETYMRAWRSFHTYAPGTNLKAWLFRILRNVNIDRHRAHSRSCSITGDSHSHQRILVSQATPESLVDGRLNRSRAIIRRTLVPAARGPSHAQEVREAS